MSASISSMIVVILIAAGAFNLVCGYLIWRRRVYGLIAGYDPRRPPRNPEALGRWVGKGAVVLGSWLVGTGVVLAFFPTHGRIIAQVMAVGVLLGVSVLCLGGLRRARG